MSIIQKISSKKDNKKFIRGILQSIFLLGVLYIIIRALFSFCTYESYTQVSEKDNGFIALSYFGVALESDEDLIGNKQLEAHIKALKDSGYVTITQQDIKDYYEQGKLLPERAIFLMFEDGRRDTSIFAQKILEEYNLIATMFSYGDKFDERDSKFLSSKDMLELEKSSFWELATNGYRLAYINVFDKDHQFLGELTAREYGQVVTELRRDYNHYLMDYIRDEYDIPMESYEQMKARIDYDYQSLGKTYESQIGNLPSMYALMHANTGQFATNDKVSAINEQWIRQLFKINFNREGYSLNTRDISIYDLTRMQPQSYWSTNHLLMRIWDDTKQDMAFVSGDLEKNSSWEALQGVAAFEEEQIVLTSMPRAQGLLRLKNSENFQDINLTVRLKGNKVGAQSIYLRADDQLNKAIQVEVKENTLYLYQVVGGSHNLVQSIALEILDEEDAPLELKQPGDRLLEINLIGNQISVAIDTDKLIEQQTVSCSESGAIYLAAVPLEEVYSQRNLTDDVYDGVFEALVITEDSGSQKGEILFDDRVQGLKKGLYEIKKVITIVVNWFINNL